MPTTPLTTPGLVIGTLQYMAPEQIEGLEADARTDIFAFGAMLHEMVTGKKAFEAKSQVLLISAIATSDPPALSSVQPRTPAALDQVVKACMAKDPDDRWQTARDLLAELRWIAEGGAAATAVVPLVATTSHRGRLVRLAIPVAAILALALAVPAARHLTASEAAAETRYWLPTRTLNVLNLEPVTPDGTLAIAPDGTRIAFLARPRRQNPADGMSVYVNRVGGLAYDLLPGTQGATQPFWSADGQWVAYFAGDRIWKVDTAGGQPQEVAPAAGFLGGSWNAEGTIIYGSASGIHRVSAEGGTPELVTTRAESETGHFWPHFLPDGRRFLYLSWSGDAAARAVVVGSLDGGEPARVLAAESNAGYARAAGSAQGYLVFHRGPAAFAQAFDERSLELTGEPVRLADDVLFQATNGRSLFDVSATGVLTVWSDAEAFGASNRTGGPESWSWQAVWADPSNGQVIATVGPAGVYRGAEVSPDGARLATHRHDDPGGDVWVFDATQGETRITFEPGDDNSMPVWSPDGAELVFSAHREGKWGLYRTRSDASSDATLVYESAEPKVATSWSKDGHIVFWQEDGQNRGDLWMLPPEATAGGSATVEPQPLLTSKADERHGQVSPDGRWLAYTSDATETGVFQVYVRPFPTGSGRWQVSTAPADWPRWSRDGKTLFFMVSTPPGSAFAGVWLHSSAVDARDGTFFREPPQPVVGFRAINVAHPGGPYSIYDVSPDPKRLLVFQRFIPEAAPTVATAAAAGADVNFGLMVVKGWAR